MAIEKIEGTPKVEWTLPTLISLGVALVLVVASGLLGWFAFSNWRFKSSLVEGYQEYDRGHASSAKKLLETALSWRPTHTGARELLAKILCDEGKLAEARTQYQRLVAQGYNQPQVHIGLGVLALKEVEALEKPKAIEALVTEAASEFRKAAAVPEAEVGIGHCDLVLARKLNNPAYYTRARAQFDKVQTAMEKSKVFRAGITRDGLVDYYTGLGKALSASDKVEEGAAAAFRACFMYTPTWSLPMANVLALEGRRFSQFNDSNETLVKMQTDINALRNQARTIFNNEKDPALKAAMKEQWLTFSLALGQAWGRAGNLNELGNIVRDLQSAGGFDQRNEPMLLDAEIRTELALRDDPNPSVQDGLVTKATAAYNELIQKLPTDDAGRERRAIAFNNFAWTVAWRGGYISSESLYQQAVQKLTEALRFYPDDYVYNRNMAIVLKRFRKPPSAPAAFLEKCRAAAAKEKDLAEDFDKLQKYIDTK
jgi:tetratricopeptide (TPR) repeat protein